jgi:hypothetical protein
MGQYRFSIYAHWQMGLMIKYNMESIQMHLPFISVHLATTKYAGGIFIFGYYFT